MKFLFVIVIQLAIYGYRVDSRVVELTCRPEVPDSCIVLGRIEADEEDSIVVANAEQWQQIDNILTVEPSNSSIFPSAIFTAWPSLRKIHIQWFGIRILSAETFENATDVEKISLEGNRIEILPKNTFAKCSHLTELDLTKNIIHRIEDDALSGLINLRKLHLTGNNLTALRRQMFADLIALEQIDLIANAIEIVEDKTFDLPKLETIFMSDNRLKTLPANLFGPRVETFDVRDNRITRLGNVFANSSQLLVILLNHNPLEDLDLLQFAQMPELHGLNIAGTGLTVSHFKSLSTLYDSEGAGHDKDAGSSASVKFNVKFLDVSENNLSNSNILSLLKPFSLLWHINLSNNGFATIDGLGQIKRTFPDMLAVSLNNNSISCEWLKSAIDEAERDGVRFDNTPTEQKNYKGTTCV